MEIGKIIEIQTNVPRPIKIPRGTPMTPIRQPEREPVPVRTKPKEKEKEREKSLTLFGGTPYCPSCGRVLNLVEGEGGLVFSCSTHGEPPDYLSGVKDNVLCSRF